MIHANAAYLAAAIEQLAETRRRGRQTREIAKATLDWANAVLEFRTALNAKRTMALPRAKMRWSFAHGVVLEDSQRSLWQMPVDTAFPRRAR